MIESRKHSVLLCVLCVLCAFALKAEITPAARAADEPLRIATFDVDATPPVGSHLAYDPMERVAGPLSARGVVLLGAGDPIVLCAVDWIGIANGGQTEWRTALAEAAGTSVHRVAVHTLHQHDAPRCDFSALEVLKPYGLDAIMFDADFARKTIARTADAIRQAVKQPKVVTHVGLGRGVVEKVASNRRILGPDGKVVAMRFTACRDPQLRAKPAGTVDPELSLVGFWQGDQPIAVLTYFATHPQSYYRTKAVNPDFPGLARAMRDAKLPGVLHVHFDGAGGNIGAGKWNDGSPENRPILAQRLANGMADAWASVKKHPITAKDVDWSLVPVALPAAPHLDEEEALLRVKNETGRVDVLHRILAAKDLVWLRRCRAGDKIDVSCLKLGPARVLHLPGELFVEYQLAAKKLRPDLFVAMAAYGEYGPGYIGTEIAYGQGGYETSKQASRVAPAVEGVLMDAIRRLLQ